MIKSLGENAKLCMIEIKSISIHIKILSILLARACPSSGSFPNRSSLVKITKTQDCQNEKNSTALIHKNFDSGLYGFSLSSVVE
jgi:hypothetical protein